MWCRWQQLQSPVCKAARRCCCLSPSSLLIQLRPALRQSSHPGSEYLQTCCSQWRIWLHNICWWTSVWDQAFCWLSLWVHSWRFHFITVWGGLFCCLSMGKLNNSGVKPVIAAIYGVLTLFQAFQGNWNWKWGRIVSVVQDREALVWCK